MRSLHRIAAGLLFMTALASASPVVADDVDRLFTEGTAALEAGKLEAALRAFQSAWKLRKTHDIAANLAQAELALGKHRDAAEHLAFALRSFPVTGKAEVRKQIEAMLTEQKKKVLAASVSVNEAGADVWIDGARAGAAPLAEPVLLEPGKHTMEVRLDGYVTDKRNFEGVAGETKAIEVTLAKRPEAAPPASASATATAAPAPRSRVPAYVMGGVGIASLIAGAVLTGVGQAAGAEVRDDAPRMPSGQPSCWRTPAPGSPTLPECDAWRAKAAEAATLGNVGTGLFVVTGLTAAGVVAYLLWPSSPRSGASAWKLAPSIGAQGGGAVLQGTF